MSTTTLSLQSGSSPKAVFVSSEPIEAPTTTRRVLHVINGEHYSGAERVQDLLAQRLVEFGFEVGFACVKPGDFADRRSCRDADVQDFPMRNRFDLGVARQLATQIQQERFELVHAHTPRSVLVGRLAARANVPLVYHVHSPTACDSTRALINWINAATEKWSIRKAAMLIAVSPSLRQRMIADGVPESQIVCVPNGVPSVPFDEHRAPPTDTWTLGTIALFRPRKGIEVLLEALALLRQKGLPVQLRAVGPFETKIYEKEVRRRADELGLASAIQWTGFSRDVHAEISQIHLFVLPSLFGEGLPMVVLEAMAAGVPVVASRVEGIPYAIQDGEQGVLVTPNDATALAGGIEQIISGNLDWLTLRKQAYIRHAETFSDRAMAQGIADVYRRVLSDGQ